VQILSILPKNKTTQTLLEKSFQWLEKNCENNWWPDKYFLTPVLGLSHGYSGYALAYAHIAAQTPHVSPQRVYELLALEDNFFDEKKHCWPDLRVGKDAKTIDAWCHGACGILLARFRIAKMLKDPEIFLKHKHALPLIINAIGTDNSTYCHGDASRIETLLEISAAYPQLISATDMEKLINKFVNKGNSALGALPASLLSPGFMHGTSGLIYATLKLLYGDKVPSML